MRQAYIQRNPPKSPHAVLPDVEIPDSVALIDKPAAGTTNHITWMTI